MTEAITDYLVGVFQGSIPKELIIFIISMLPIVELRGGMIAAKLLGIELTKAFVICRQHLADSLYSFVYQKNFQISETVQSNKRYD